MNSYKIAVIKGDGIGPEIINEAKKVLESVALVDNFKLLYTDYLMGGIAIDKEGVPLPDSTLEGAIASDAVLFGAIGGDKWDDLPRELRPESGLLKLRKELGAYANIRPIEVYDELVDESALKPEIIKGANFVIVRELVSGIYFGKPREITKQRAFNTMSYTREEIVRLVKEGFILAQNRNKKLCSVDKANVLEVSQFWRDIVNEMASDYPDVEVSHMYVDNAAMQLIKNPKQFDVIVTSNMFGDILSDEAGMISGSIGLLPSASIGKKTAIYEPIHGSAPDIANQNIANPISTIASASMMLRYSLNLPLSADKIDLAIKKALKDGYRTKDLTARGDIKIMSTSQMGDIIANNISAL